MIPRGSTAASWREKDIGIDASAFRKAADVMTQQGYERAGGKPVAAALRTAANAVRRHVRAELKPHRKTGRMISNVRVRFRGYGMKTVAGVRSTGSGSNLIAGGVKPHAIAPGKVMPMYEGKGKGLGITGFARAVQHPGFPADPFFSRGVKAASGDIQAAIDLAAGTMAAALADRMEGRA